MAKVTNGNQDDEERRGTYLRTGRGALWVGCAATICIVGMGDTLASSGARTCMDTEANNSVCSTRASFETIVEGP